MAEMTPHEMAGKLRAAGFQRTGPSAAALSDPIADTPMVVTLDQLRPYDHDPRVKRNPAYDEIKASIRERGLDAPPAITRRPAKSTSSSATAATPAGDPARAVERNQAGAVFPHLLPVPPLARTWRNRRPDRTPG